MNTDLPSDPRAELEASLTALLLGELPEAEAERLQEAMSRDPELARTHERLKQAIEMVRLAEAEPAVAQSSTSPAPKLSDNRRQELLQKFKTVEPEEFASPKVSSTQWLLPAGIAALLLAVLSYTLMPSLSRTKTGSLALTDESRRQRKQAGSEIRDQSRLAEPFDGRTVYRELARNPGSDQKVQELAESRLKSVAPLDSHAQEGQRTEAAATTTGIYTGGSYGGMSFIGPTTSGSPSPAMPPPQEAPAVQNGVRNSFGDAAIAEDRFMRRYGLPEHNLADNSKTGNEAEEKLSERSQTFAFQGMNDLKAVSSATNSLDTWSLAPALPSLQLGAEVAANTDSLARSGALAGPAESLGVTQLPRESFSKDYGAKHATLGDEPVLGKLFKSTAQSAEGLNEPAKADQDKPEAKAPTETPAIAVIAGSARALNEQKEKERVAKPAELAQLRADVKKVEEDVGLARTPTPPPIPQPEIATRENAFSTFSLNVSDVSFKLAAASLEHNLMPDAASIRAEEFINAFEYRDPEPAPGAPFAFAWERARYPFAQKRDLLRLSLKAAAQGRQSGRPLNVVLLLDNSGSMERADRVRIIHEALRVLATQLQAQDRLSVVTFARTARLWMDGIPGEKAGQVAEEVGGLTPEGGTNLEEAMKLGYQTALRHYQADGINRVVLLTDGAANLGDVDAGRLKEQVEAHRKQGIALDCFGIGWDGYNDDLLETLSRNGDGRYSFLNSPEEAASRFATRLAGALHTAAADVKVQVEFNPDRVTAYRQIGYAKHQLTKEQFRDNTVDAAELAAAESGNALFVLDANPAGSGPLATVRVRFKVPGTTEYQEHAWTVPCDGNAVALEQASPALRLAGTAGAFAEWLSSSPYAAEITSDALLRLLSGLPEVYGADPRPGKLEWMVRQAKSLSGH